MALRFVVALCALVLTAGCASQPAVKRRAEDPKGLVGNMPWVPQTRAGVEAWVAEYAHPRDRSVDLDATPAYVETALGDDSSVPRVGYFFLKAPWRVGAVVYWLSKAELPPKTGEQKGAVWGLPAFATSQGPELYVPGAHVLLRVLRNDFVAPGPPPVSLPADIPIKTPTRTFHRDRLFAVADGKIWFKRNPSRDGTRQEPWRLLGDGLPWPRRNAETFDRPNRIAAVTADGDDLLAIDENGRAYLCTTASKSLSSQDGWEDGWGFPGKRPLYFDDRAKDARSLAIGRRAEHALYFEDAIGNPHHFGPMGTTTLYLLHRQGAEVLFTDNGLPNDFSRNLCGPDDGRFEAESLSASASALFLIDRHGRIATRFDDYDLNGGTPNFEYTYRSVIRYDDKGEDFGTSQAPYFLPLQPWRWHAPPKLEGRAQLSRDITVLQTGVGNAARELRIAGLGPDGSPGYYRKGIGAAAWLFVPSGDVTIDPPRLLSSEDVARGSAEYERTGGRFEDSTLPRMKSYRGSWRGELLIPVGDAEKPLPGVTLAMDWNPYCPPARLKISAGAETVEATLHTVDLWTPEKRQRPGFDGTPLLLLGTLVFEDEVLTDERPAVRGVMKHLRPFHHATFGLLLAMDDDHLEVRAIDEGPGKKFPLSLRLQRTGIYDPPDPTQVTRASASLQWLRAEDPAALLDTPQFKVDVNTAPVAAIAAALEENRKLQTELRAALEAQKERLAAIDAFRDRWKFVAPLLPLGRVNILPKLLGLETVRGHRISITAESQWKAIDESLRGRIAEYEGALKQRQ